MIVFYKYVNAIGANEHIVVGAVLYHSASFNLSLVSLAHKALTRGCLFDNDQSLTLVFIGGLINFIKILFGTTVLFGGLGLPFWKVRWWIFVTPFFGVVWV